MSQKNAPRLSKSRYVAGWQCAKLLWWTVHEPDAAELQPDKVLKDLFHQGVLVGEVARGEFPAGVLISGERFDKTRVPRTREAIDRGAEVVFEGCFEADGVFCAVDVVEKRPPEEGGDGGGWTLIEVKSSSEVKDYHIPDLAVQVHVARRAGLDVRRVEVMHLNREHRHPDQGSLFVRADVTRDVEAAVREVPARVAEQLEMLRGPLPECAIGMQCYKPRECAFWKRCWPSNRDHISELYRAGPTGTTSWMARGVHCLGDIPTGTKLNDTQKRQLRAVKEGRLIVERTLADALAPALAADRLGFLDFETVMRALPPWRGLAPWAQTAAQYSYHERQPDGEYSHHEFLAEGPENPGDPPDDPREPLARAMLEATRGADLVVVYTHFEGTRIKELAAHLPHLADELLALKEKLWDLCKVVRDHVYHPDFGGSFSLKDILNPLVPDESYDDLVIVDGRVASVEIARLLFVSGRIPPAERDRTRRDLLEYCRKDTWATARLVEALAELAAG